VWQTCQWLHYGKNFVNTAIVDQSLERIYLPVEGNTGPVWYYCLELLKYPHPWLFLALFGFALAWQHRNWGWGKLILTWSVVYLIVVSAMITKLPWYIMPIYPALALAAGVALAEVKSLPNYYPYPRSWIVFFSIFSLLIAAGIVYFSVWGNTNYELLIILGFVCLTMGITAIMMGKRDGQFMIVLFWGMYVGLLLFFSSNYWLWELNEAFPVKPVASLIKSHVPLPQKVYTSFDYERPSLNFYSERKVIPLSQVIGEGGDRQWKNVKQFWQDQNNHYLLVNKAMNQDILTQLNLKDSNCKYKLTEAVESEDSTLESQGNSQGKNICLTSTTSSEWLLFQK